MSFLRALSRGVFLGGIGLVTSGCFEDPRSCDASNELDFAPVKAMAGTWKGPGSWALLFEEDGRPYSFDPGIRFSCSPGHYPLVLNDPNFLQNHVGDIETTLVSALIEENHFILNYELTLAPSRIEVRLRDAEHLEYTRNDDDSPRVFTRICDDLCDPKTGLPLDDESSE